MVSLSGSTPGVEPPPVRHGTCRLTLTIGGTDYALRPIPGQPRGMHVYCLRPLNGERAGKIYSVAIVNREAGCTCPDAEVNGAVCKHVMALRAIGFVPISARTASESKAEAARVAATRRRRTAAPAAAEVIPPAGLSRRRLQRHAVTLAAALPPQPPQSPFVAGWHQAVNQHVTALAKGGVH